MVSQVELARLYAHGLEQDEVFFYRQFLKTRGALLDFPCNLSLFCERTVGAFHTLYASFLNEKLSSAASACIDEKRIFFVRTQVFRKAMTSWFGDARPVQMSAHNLDRYYSDPKEQVGKYLAYELLGGIELGYQKDNLNLPKAEQQAICNGQTRVAELGWENIFKGEYGSRHEIDYIVHDTDCGASTAKALTDSINGMVFISCEQQLPFLPEESSTDAYILLEELSHLLLAKLPYGYLETA